MAGQLPARYVIHAVGPVWQGGDRGEAELLRGAHLTSLELARDHACQSIAFPAISTGVYGYPLDLAAQVALQTAHRFLQEADPLLVRFVLFDEAAFQAFCQVLGRLVEG